MYLEATGLRNLKMKTVRMPMKSFLDHVISKVK